MAIAYSHLWEQLIGFENLLSALRKASKGKRGQPVVADFLNNRERYLWVLRQRLSKLQR